MDGGIGKLAGLKMLAPGDDVSARHDAELGGMPQTGEGRKLSDINFVNAACFGVRDVREPLKLGRNLGELTELDRRQRILFIGCINRNQLFSRGSPPCFPSPYSVWFITG